MNATGYHCACQENGGGGGGGGGSEEGERAEEVKVGEVDEVDDDDDEGEAESGGAVAAAAFTEAAEAAAAALFGVAETTPFLRGGRAELLLLPCGAAPPVLRWPRAAVEVEVDVFVVEGTIAAPWRREWARISIFSTASA